jgi:hypothetical protein
LHRDTGTWPAERTYPVFRKWFEVRLYPLIQVLVGEEFTGSMRTALEGWSSAEPVSPGLGVGSEAAMRLDEFLAQAPRIREIAAAHGASNLAAFGSVARDQAGPDSDLDLLIDLPPNTGLLGRP